VTCLDATKVHVLSKVWIGYCLPDLLLLLDVS
jgi:hypothetical protein